MPAIKVLMLARPNLFTYPGGDTTQVSCTAKALRKLGLQVDINPEKARYEQYDLLHFFNIIDPEDILGHLKRTTKPFVVSTIYCLYEEYDRYHRGLLASLAYRLFSRNGVEYLKTITKWIVKGESISSPEFLWRGHRGSIKKILQKTACLLPNSINEYNRLVADFGIEKKYVVVPNGVDIPFYSGNNKGKSSLVLCVARIEGRKNQLNLIRGVQDTDLSLVLIGLPAKNQQAYYRKCRQLAGANVQFAGYVDQKTLRKYYGQAKVHILPSWFETTGLSSLEAALMGCNVVVSDRGDVKEYFRNDAWYCDPADPASIRKAIRKAMEAPYSAVLANRIRTEYNWETAAEYTLRGYQLALEKK